MIKKKERKDGFWGVFFFFNSFTYSIFLKAKKKKTLLSTNQVHPGPDERVFSAGAVSFYLAVAQISGGRGPRLLPLTSSVGLRPEGSRFSRCCLRVLV